MKKLSKNKKIVVGLSALVVVVLIAISIYIYISSVNKKKDDAFLPKKEEKVLEDQSAITEKEESSTESSANIVPNQSSASLEPVININKPTKGTTISTDRSVSGTAKNVGDIVYYEVVGAEAGLVAEGSWSISADKINLQPFSGEVAFTRKPISGDSGSIKFYSKSGGPKTLLTSVDVGF